MSVDETQGEVSNPKSSAHATLVASHAVDPGLDPVAIHFRDEGPDGPPDVHDQSQTHHSKAAQLDVGPARALLAAPPLQRVLDLHLQRPLPLRVPRAPEPHGLRSKLHQLLDAHDVEVGHLPPLGRQPTGDVVLGVDGAAVHVPGADADLQWRQAAGRSKHLEGHEALAQRSRRRHHGGRRRGATAQEGGRRDGGPTATEAGGRGTSVRDLSAPSLHALHALLQLRGGAARALLEGTPRRPSGLPRAGRRFI
mmetsp:Transcript_15893/g.40872  ORF Transcript_15893/g.40872 Transcript_15893/m.40872 type:complete len:252 (-) Transcript_15893:75-830(-)